MMGAKLGKIAETMGAKRKMYRSSGQTTAYSIKKRCQMVNSTIQHLFQILLIISSPFSYDTPWESYHRRQKTLFGMLIEN